MHLQNSKEKMLSYNVVIISSGTLMYAKLPPQYRYYIPPVP